MRRALASRAVPGILPYGKPTSTASAIASLREGAAAAGRRNNLHAAKHDVVGEFMRRRKLPRIYFMQPGKVTQMAVLTVAKALVHMRWNGFPHSQDISVREHRHGLVELSMVERQQSARGLEHAHDRDHVGAHPVRHTVKRPTSKYSKHLRKAKCFACRPA